VFVREITPVGNFGVGELQASNTTRKLLRHWQGCVYFCTQTTPGLWLTLTPTANPSLSCPNW